MRDHHRRLLTLQLAHLDCLDEQINLLGAEITRALTALGSGDPPASPAEGLGAGRDASAPDTSAGPLSFAGAMSVLDTIPGIDQRGAELLVAE